MRPWQFEGEQQAGVQLTSAQAKGREKVPTVRELPRECNYPPTPGSVGVSHGSCMSQCGIVLDLGQENCLESERR